MPTRSLPADLIPAGSSAIAASFLFSAPTVPLLVGFVELLDFELFTQPVRATAPAATALIATRAERRANTGSVTSVGVDDGRESRRRGRRSGLAPITAARLAP